MGAVAWASWQRSVSHPRSSNRNVDLRHPALRLVSPMIQTAAKIDAITNGRNAEWSLAFPIRNTSSRPVPPAGLQATSPNPLLRSPRRLFRPLPALPHWSGPAHTHAQDVFPVNLVVEQVEAERRLGLRLTIQLSLKGLDRYRCCQAHRKSPSPHHLRKHTRSQGPLLNWHCPASTLVRPVRLPPGPAPVATLRLLPSPMTGLPRLPEPPFRRAVPTTPADRAGACVDYFPAHAGSSSAIGL